MKSKIKWILNVAFMLLLLSFILYYVFHEQDPLVLIRLMHDANGWYWLAGIVLVFLFISGESVILRLLLNNVGSPPPKGHCLLYSFIGFFFSAITPAAGGGQPLQIYYMNKDGLDPGVTSPILVIVTIGFKIVLIFYGLLAIIFRPKVIFESNDIAFWWGATGFVLNIIVISVFLLVIFKTAFVKSILYFIMKILKRFIKSNRIDRLEKRLNGSISKYEEVIHCIKRSPGLIAVVFFISIIQRSLQFSITWLVLLSFGIRGYSLPLIIMMQAMVSLGTDLLPLPGASGANEALFLLLFESVCGEHLVLPVMVASRGIAFYGLLIICGIFTFIGTNIIRNKNHMEA